VLRYIYREQLQRNIGDTRPARETTVRMERATGYVDGGISGQRVVVAESLAIHSENKGVDVVTSDFGSAASHKGTTAERIALWSNRHTASQKLAEVSRGR